MTKRTLPDPDSILGLANELGRLLTEVDGKPREPITVEHRFTDAVCYRCGQKVTISATANDFGEIRWVCPDCSAGDPPVYRPDTAWGM